MCEKLRAVSLLLRTGRSSFPATDAHAGGSVGKCDGAPRLWRRACVCEPVAQLRAVLPAVTVGEFRGLVVGNELRPRVTSASECEDALHPVAEEPLPDASAGTDVFDELMLEVRGVLMLVGDDDRVTPREPFGDGGCVS